METSSFKKKVCAKIQDIKCKYHYYLLFLVCFTLPMYMRLNNIILGLLLILSLISGISKKHKQRPNFLKAYSPVLAFFALAVIASSIGENPSFFKSLERYWSFILIPLAFWISNTNYLKLRRYAFYGLIAGCISTLLVCYVNAIYELIIYQEPTSYFFKWRHLSHRFTEVADTHPAYLGLFICSSTYYILFQLKDANTKSQVAIISFFFLGMFQLSARLALATFLLTLLTYAIYYFRRNLKYIISGIILVSLSVLVFISQGSEYFQERLFSLKSVTEDTRFRRLEASYDVFRKKPILGVGFANIDQQRTRKYKEKGFQTAAEKGYNAHNQFFEYLSINGIIGGLTYLGAFIYLFRVAFVEKHYLFMFILITFFIANLTESMLVRIKGIEYFSIFVSLFLINRKTRT